nr:6-phosphogluconolactonase [Corynebacterium lactis]
MSNVETNTGTTAPNFPSFERFADQGSVVEAARARFVSQIEQLQGTASDGNGAAAVTDDGFVRVVLTGGGAGTALLSALAEDSGKIDWSRVLVFFGDERFVARDSDERNARAARERLLGPVGVPEENIFEFAAAGEGVSTVKATDEYEGYLEQHAPDGFDLHLLGMGGEGHINSIFPHSPALAEKDHYVVDVHNCPKPPPTRITLTMPAIARSTAVWLLVTGPEKAEAVGAISRAADPQQWPSAGVRGREETLVFVDDAAAAEL